MNSLFKCLASYDAFGGAVEEMNERSVMKAICCIEQKLLLNDVSPSIHNVGEEEENDSKQRVGIS